MRQSMEGTSCNVRVSHLGGIWINLKHEGGLKPLGGACSGSGRRRLRACRHRWKSYGWILVLQDSHDVTLMQCWCHLIGFTHISTSLCLLNCCLKQLFFSWTVCKIEFKARVKVLRLWWGFPDRQALLFITYILVCCVKSIKKQSIQFSDAGKISLCILKQEYGIAEGSYLQKLSRFVPSFWRRTCKKQSWLTFIFSCILHPYLLFLTYLW
jgi:hypothetical protein